MEPAQLKSIGYLVSIGSVLLLGAVCWSSAGDDAGLRAMLVLGVLSSILGMLMRWYSYEVEHRRTEAGSRRERGAAR